MTVNPQANPVIQPARLGCIIAALSLLPTAHAQVTGQIYADDIVGVSITTNDGAVLLDEDVIGTAGSSSLVPLPTTLNAVDNSIGQASVQVGVDAVGPQAWQFTAMGSATTPTTSVVNRLTARTGPFSGPSNWKLRLTNTAGPVFGHLRYTWTVSTTTAASAAVVASDPKGDVLIGDSPGPGVRITYGYPITVSGPTDVRIVHKGSAQTAGSTSSPPVTEAFQATLLVEFVPGWPPRRRFFSQFVQPSCAPGGDLEVRARFQAGLGGESAPTATASLTNAPPGALCTGVLSIGGGVAPLGAYLPTHPGCLGLIPFDELINMGTVSLTGEAGLTSPVPAGFTGPVFFQVVTFNPADGRFASSNLVELNQI